ncbi:hypothetical protein CALCODRAFT_510919 [Calocera cornea HHB12733]|uniref:Fungal STAND N-terminal Goodbye domain-containing protein n=1 Tax=Calocera cornea HHB12733 TaxID=1353952 RepID=A0A165E5Q8_9BASI|nr:hypothetical protein CALCODRAFT_510919 [Calocera cornea HHB12733]
MRSPKWGKIDWRVEAATPALHPFSERAPAEVGMVALSVPSWFASKDALILVPSTDSEAIGKTRVRLLLHRRETSTGAAATARDLGAALDVAKAYASQAGIGTSNSKMTETLNNTEGTVQTLAIIGKALMPLLKNLTWFVDAMTVVSQVHPAASAAWSAVTLVHHLVEDQKKLDERAQGLLEKINDIYSWICHTKDLTRVRDKPGSLKAQETALICICEQTKQCAEFIVKYARVPGFLGRLAQCISLDVDKQINQYTQRLDDLQQNFQTGTMIRMQAVTHETLDKLTDIVDALDQSGSEEERRRLLSVIRDRLVDLPDTIKFFITCRHGRDIGMMLSMRPDVMVKEMPTMEDPSVLEDIFRYIQDKLPTLPEELCWRLANMFQDDFECATEACQRISALEVAKALTVQQEEAVLKEAHTIMQQLHPKPLAKQSAPEVEVMVPAPRTQHLPCSANGLRSPSRSRTT